MMFRCRGKVGEGVVDNSFLGNKGQKKVPFTPSREFVPNSTICPGNHRILLPRKCNTRYIEKGHFVPFKQKDESEEHGTYEILSALCGQAKIIEEKTHTTNSTGGNESVRKWMFLKINQMVKS